MTNFLNFIRDDAGAVTIDWVALTAGILILGVGIVAALFDEVQTLVDGMESNLLQADDGLTVS
jgi:hypothetical protein